MLFLQFLFDLLLIKSYLKGIKNPKEEC